MKSALALALAWLAAAPPSFPVPSPRAPTGRWVLDFAPTQCLASRDYGNAGRPLTLAIRPSAVGDVIQLALVLAGHRANSREIEDVPVSVRIDAGAPIETSALAMNDRVADRRTLRINLAAARLADLRGARQVTFAYRDAPGESFALSLMAPLMDAMDQCLADLRRLWNVDTPLKARAKPDRNLVSYVTDSDYPPNAVDRGLSGDVGFVMLIDESGKVADCMVTSTSKVPMLDIQTCAIVMTRPRFTPAVGLDGKPTKDAVPSHIRWVLP